ncbi:penicillin-binding transpeptidase domain-containing protein [Gordonia alkaliphila]|uniref:penicillin-binding transpeptidase domain-containing protein n=1 Tax=Gordonia alkaliphila TaxID=1053547 RepID=UPI0031F0688E
MFAAIVLNTELAVRLLAVLTRPDVPISRHALALVQTTLTVFLFGSLFIARLNVLRNPGALYTERADIDWVGDSLVESVKAILVAPYGLALALGVLLWLSRRTHLLGRISDWTGSRIRHHAPATAWTFAVATCLLYLLPTFGPGAPLTIVGVATPEIAKITYFVTLAIILGAFSHRFRDTSRGQRGQPEDAEAAPDLPESARSGPGWFHANPQIWAPIALFAAISGINVLRDDLGPIVPVFLATVATLVLVMRHQVLQTLRLSSSDATGRARTEFLSAIAYSKKPAFFLVGLCVVMLVGILVNWSYVGARVAAWQNTWTYPWGVTCVDDVPEGWGAPPSAEPDTALGQTGVVDFPTETAKPCLQAYESVQYSNQAQIARGLGAIADGGLWGRGLYDQTSQTVPIARFDLILAAIWSKLGGIVVALLSVLLTLIGYSLVKLGLSRQRGTSDQFLSTASIYAIGIGWVIVAQYLFQVVMTLNAFPHSGITAPFLSQGFQANLALLLGIVTAVWAVYRSTDGDPVPPDDSARPLGSPLRPQLPVTSGALIVILALIAAITIWPYQGLPEDRDLCTTADIDDYLVDPQNCSTDLTALSTPTASVQIDGREAFVYDGSWTATGDSPVSSPSMATLLAPGVMNRLLNNAVGSSAGQPTSGLSRRLLPPPRITNKEVSVDLTIDASLQTALAKTATSSTESGVGPLPVGMTVVDTRNGHVLAAVSAPAQGESDSSEPGEQPASDTDTRTQYNNRMLDEWFVDGQPVTLDQCQAASRSGKLCARWQGETAVTAPLDDDYRRRYVGGDESVALPGDTVNRAFGQAYGLGSTFKVILAATYLQRPDSLATDLIPAPLTSEYDGITFRNYGRGACPGTVDGQVSLRDALAYSCNTAFIELANTIGWESVRTTALAFGFELPQTFGVGAGLAGTTLGVPSEVPSQAFGAQLAVSALGGGEVVGTPLRMSSVLATVANNGTLVQPTLVNGMSRDGSTLPAPPQTRTAVLTPAAAEQLQSALSATTEVGTAKLLTGPDDRPLFVKTGTHEIVEGDDPTPAGQFERQIAWIVGYIDHFAFAVAVTTRDEKVGGQHARLLAQTIIDQVTGTTR